MTHGKLDVKVGTLLLGNDKNNVIADKALCYFKFLSSNFEVYITHLANKY